MAVRNEVPAFPALFPRMLRWVLVGHFRVQEFGVLRLLAHATPSQALSSSSPVRVAIGSPTRLSMPRFDGIESARQAFPRLHQSTRTVKASRVPTQLRRESLAACSIRIPD